MSVIGFGLWKVQIIEITQNLLLVAAQQYFLADNIPTDA